MIRYLVLASVLFSFCSLNLLAKAKLTNFAYNVYSQFGEDGIIEKIFEIIGTESKVCIEFGAWDGFHLSNTAKLWSNEDWYGILIEGDREKVAQLRKNVESYNCTCIGAYVGNESHDSLEALLRNHTVFPAAVDLLSIDIDSNDYYIFESLTILHPRLIICEYNPTLPVEYDIYFPYGTNWGCSAGALIRIAQEKGYKLIAMTDSNCFFVKNEDFSKFSEFETDLQKLKINKYLKFLSTNYLGEYIIAGEWDKSAYGIYRPYNGDMYSPHVTIYKK